MRTVYLAAGCCRSLRRLACLAVTVCCAVSSSGEEPAAKNPARLTPTVRLVRKCLPAVVAVRAHRPSDKQGVFDTGHGGGSVIHPGGYILTNDHVVRDAQRLQVAFFRGEWQAARIIALMPQEDLAIIKIESEKPLPTLPLGRSDDLELGESVIAIGSPGGLPHTLSTGVISGLDRSTNTEHAFLPDVVQTSAAVSGGSSGGPLINANGRQIGVVTSRKSDGENLGFAITADRVRRVFPRLIAAEQRYGIVHGIEIEMLAPHARVATVAGDSPAAKAGIRPGDAIRAIEGRDVRHGWDFYLALIDRKPGERIALTIDRGGKKVPMEFPLDEFPVREPVTTGELQPGLRKKKYAGKWQQLPDFAPLAPQQTSIDTKSPRVEAALEEDHFGFVYSGYLQIPEPGLHTFFISSDDGSRLWIGERLIIDNDGLHAAREVGALQRLNRGTYPFRLEYFEAGGEQSLRVQVSGPHVSKRELPGEWLFHAPAQ